MTEQKQPEALAFCWATELAMTQQPVTLSVTEAREVSAEMQRLHAENTTLQQGYAAARLEIESLQARIKTMAEEHADELTVAHMDGRSQAAQQSAPPAAAVGVTAEQRRLIGVIADKIEDGSLFQAGIYSKKDLARFVRNVLDATPQAAPQPAPAGEESKPHGWLYDWTHSSATGKPDTTYTGFTKDEAHARKHDNCTAVFTTPKPPATQQAGEVSDAMVLAALQVQYPTAYGQYLRHPANGPKTSLRTELEIDTARRMIAAALAAAPQPTPTPQADSVLEDAARYRFLRDVPMGLWPAELLSAIRLQQNAKWDAVIDAARTNGDTP